MSKGIKQNAQTENIIKCDCLSIQVKNQIERSNLPDSIKKELMSTRTCGEISDTDVTDIIRKTKPFGDLETVIAEMKKHGVVKSEIDEKLLRMRSEGKIRLEPGMPIGVFGKELDDITVHTARARYAYAKVTKQ